MPHCRVILAAALTLALTGCGSPPSALTGPKAAYAQHCATCHAQAGEPGGPKLGSSKGTDLSHIGSKRDRTVEWIAEYIRDPKSQRSDARMPGFEGKLTVEEIRALAELLAAQK